MPDCICCHCPGAVALTCLHFICKQCFDAVKCEDSVFCAECCVLSDIKPDSEKHQMFSSELSSERSVTWEQAAATKFSALPTRNIKIRKHSEDIEKTAGCYPLKTFLPDLGNIPAKFGDHRPPPDYFWCSVLYPISPQKVCVHVHDEELEEFKLMHNNMQKAYNSMPISKKIMAKDLKTGVCYSLKRKGVWHRATFMPVSKRVAVSLIDDGDQYSVHMYDRLSVEPLPPGFKDFPAQAVHCSLDITPRCPLKKKNQICPGPYVSCWHAECRELLKKLANSTALCFVEKNSSAELKITMYIEGQEKCLNQLIIENGWARNKLEDHLDQFKILDAKRKQILPVTSPVRIPRIKEIKGQWAFTLPSDRWPKKFKGVVTWVDDRGSVYIHTTEWSSKLVYIRDRLKEYFASSPSPSCSLEVGDCCFAKFKGNWFRAVLNVITDEEATVFLVDFGVVQQIPLQAIRRENLFFKIPVQTYRCELYGIKLTNAPGSGTKCPMESALNLLHDVTVNNEFIVTVNRLNPLLVSLTCPANNVNVADLLVAAKKAKYR